MVDQVTITSLDHQEILDIEEHEFVPLLTFLTTMFNFRWLKNFVDWLGTFPNAFSENSTKLLALLICALTGGFVVGIIIPFTLVWDVVTNGYIKTDLTDYGIFTLCIGGMMFGASATVKVPDWLTGNKNKKKKCSPGPFDDQCGDDEES